MKKSIHLDVLGPEDHRTFKDQLLIENIRSLKIIGVIGSAVNVVIISALFNLQGVACFEFWDTRLRLLWILASILYIVSVGRPNSTQAIKPYQRHIFFFAAGLSLFFSAAITGLTSLTTGYTFLFIINCMLTAAFLYLSLAEIIWLLLPSIIYLAYVILTNENSQLTFLGNVMNILSTVMFSLAICARAYRRQWQLFIANLSIQTQNQKLTNLAEIDGLTQLPNRRKFDQVAAIAWTHGQREGAPLSVLMLDVDFFKHYNDTYGHLAGDDCLRQIAAVLSRVVHRESDLVARYGGEEFVVLLPMTPAAGALQLAESIRAALYNEHILHEGLMYPCVTISVGLATVSDFANTSLDTLIDQADQALYQSKVNGRNRVSCFESPLEASC